MKWLVLIHQLPPRPLYLRAKIRRRLTGVGALALKNSVYVLPERDDCLEDLQWIAQEARAGGGEAFVCRAEFVEGASDEPLVQRFRAGAAAAYASLRGEIRAALLQARRRGGSVRGAEALPKLEKRLGEIAALDFFAAPGRKEAETMLKTLGTRIRPGARGSVGASPGAPGDLLGRTWVTRRGPKVDRLGSAWLIRRFLDPGARFRFIDAEREQPRGGEIGFDMPGGVFTHEGERCTFETLASRLGISDSGVRALAEIVHDIDLKDGKFGRPECEGVRRLVEGLVHAHPSDTERLERGLALFDDLYASFAAAGGAREPRRPAKAPAAAARPRRRRRP